MQFCILYKYKLRNRYAIKNSNDGLSEKFIGSGAKTSR
ncbi:hypothetical protein bmyco0003_52810 [Bacillus pseudomycoides]|nr:hypothetical protein bmyco0003_52810 [Bacillus pseudomycoides]